VPRQSPAAIRASEDQVREVRRRIARLEAAGMTRQRIAQEAGVSGSTITRLAAGQFRAPSRATVAAVLAVRVR
jgi:transcriptional regulator with XRE-family HTH domain